MASTVIYTVPITVNTTGVTYRTGIALDVSPDGQGQFVTQVRLFTAYITNKKCF